LPLISPLLSGVGQCSTPPLYKKGHRSPHRWAQCPGKLALPRPWEKEREACGRGGLYWHQLTQSPSTQLSSSAYLHLLPTFLHALALLSPVSCDQASASHKANWNSHCLAARMNNTAQAQGICHRKTLRWIHCPCNYARQERGKPGKLWVAAASVLNVASCTPGKKCAMRQRIQNMHKHYCRNRATMQHQEGTLKLKA